ncbi:hypothetical protein Golomagni_02192 [Golovinomyces magnicellulatus]|nr:hypothetical protein Golomagni_02192 [Golovinomyces magnicellulatus]
MAELTHLDLEWGSILASFYDTFPAIALVLRGYGLSADPSTLIHDINKNTHSPSFICLAAMLKAFDDGFNRQAQQNAELSETNENLSIRIRHKNVVINELKDILKNNPAEAPTPPAPTHYRRISSDPVIFNAHPEDSSTWKWKTADQLFKSLDSQYETPCSRALQLVVFRSLDRSPASDDFSGWIAKGSRFYEKIQEYEHNLKTKGEGNRPYQNQLD